MTKDQAPKFERWQINLWILWTTQVISLMGFGFGIPFMSYFIQELGVVDPVALKSYTGLLSAAPAVTMAIMSPIWGVLSDRFGQKLMLQRAMFAAVFVIGGMGAVTHVWHLFVLRLLQGVFTGTVTASSAFVAVNTPNHKLSYALGMLSSSTFIGYTLGPLLGGLVADAFGYRISFFVGGAIMLLGFILASLFLKEDKKEKVGGKKQGFTLKNVKNLIVGTVGILLILLFVQRILRTVFTPFLPLYIQLEFNGGSAEGVAKLTGAVNGLVGFMTALSAVIIGKLSEKFSKIKLMQTMMLLGFILAIGLSIYGQGTLVGFTLMYSLLFFIIGGVEPLLTAISAEQTPSHYRGTLFGIQGLVGSLGWMVSPAIGTYLSIALGYSAILWFQVLVIAISVACLTWLKVCYVNNN